MEESRKAALEQAELLAAEVRDSISLCPALQVKEGLQRSLAEGVEHIVKQVSD